VISSARTPIATIRPTISTRVVNND